MQEQSNGKEDLVLDLRPDSPDNDRCAREDCRLPRFVHPINLPDPREQITHYFAVEADVVR